MNKEINKIVRKQDDINVAATRKQIRGSSLLLAGKWISVAINFATQILIVRYLSKSDYGAWAYSLALVAFLQAFVTFGLDRAITRFVPIYHENNEYEKLFGTILLVFGTIIIVGLIIIGAIYIVPEYISQLHRTDEENYQIELLFILIFLLPIQGIDGALIGLFASFSRPRAIFFRKHVIGPMLKLTVALLLIAFEGSVVFLAYGYLCASLVGILIYISMLLRILKQEGIFRYFLLKSVKIPAREIFAFTIPLFSSDLLVVAMHSTDILLLGYFHDTTAVASYQVILPIATTNAMVMASFGLLYTPLAARLFAKDDYSSINELYWRTAIWLSVLSFPIFILTFSMAEPIILLLYGARYEDSWIFLQMLAFAYYFNVALGMNGLTLKVLGKVRYIVIINFIVLIINLFLNISLIPHYGALGAAISTATSMICHNILKQLGLRLVSGINIFEWKYLSFYFIIIISTMGLFLLQFYITNSIYILVPLTAVVCLAVIKICQKHLRAQETFPELLKLPIIKFLIS